MQQELEQLSSVGLS